MRTLAAALVLTCGIALQAAAPVPRPSPEFKIHELPGKDTMVSSLKGKVVVIQFLFTSCPHCQAAAKWLSQMQAELGPKGLQVYGVAINGEEVSTPDPKVNLANVNKFKEMAKYPVGVSLQADALKYLGLSVMDQWGVPQFVVIDKKGVIRSQTHARPMKGEVVEEPVMRELVAKLLAEK